MIYYRFLCFDHMIRSPTTSWSSYWRSIRGLRTTIASAKLVCFLILIANHHSIKRKVRLLLANLKVSLNKFSYRFPVWPYWLIYIFKETCFTRLYTQICSALAQTGRQSRGFFRFSAAVKCVITLGYPYINNQCSSLVDITYANYWCHEPEKNRRFHWRFNFGNIRFGSLGFYGCKWGIFEAR